MRKYDDNVLRQLNGTTKKQIVLGKGSVFNAYLPNLEKVTNALKHDISRTFCYTGINGKEEQLTFLLPQIENNNKMLYMELISINNDEDIEGVKKLLKMRLSAENEQEDEETINAFLIENKETVFAKVIFWAKNDVRYKKGSDDKYNNYGKFLCTKENYCKMWEKDSAKYIFVTDEDVNIHYIFKCWMEELPIPGQSDVPSVFAYVDGSAAGSTFGAGAILCMNDILMSYDSGEAKEANFASECIALTNVFKYLCKREDNYFQENSIDEVHIYFDNTQLGYVPVEMYAHEKDVSKDMWNIIGEFEKKYPNIKLVFEHVDAHTAIYGNEMADRLATVKIINDEPKDARIGREKLMNTRNAIWSNGDNSFKLFDKKL